MYEPFKNVLLKESLVKVAEKYLYFIIQCQNKIYES